MKSMAGYVQISPPHTQNLHYFILRISDNQATHMYCNVTSILYANPETFLLKTCVFSLYTVFSQLKKKKKKSHSSTFSSRDFVDREVFTDVEVNI